MIHKIHVRKYREYLTARGWVLVMEGDRVQDHPFVSVVREERYSSGLWWVTFIVTGEMAEKYVNSELTTAKVVVVIPGDGVILTQVTATWNY